MGEKTFSGQVALMSFFQFYGHNRLWAMRQVVKMPDRLRQQKGILFFKTLGTSGGLGCMGSLNFKQGALLTVWPSADDALDFYWNSNIMDDYRLKSSEDYSVLLRPVRSGKKWAGSDVFEPQAMLPEKYPIAILSRARSKLRLLLPFRLRMCGVSRSAKDCRGPLFSRGVGERPRIHESTFSIWESMEALKRYAYGEDNNHQVAVKASRKDNEFKEALYAAFQVTGHRGTIKGINPLDKIKTPSLL